MAFTPEIYAKGLHGFLREQSELSLSNAYTLGRVAMSDGISLTELLHVHFSAVSALVAEENSALPFLTEAVAPYEMSLRGFREATDALRVLNSQLNTEVERRTQELWEAQESLRQAQKIDSIGRMAGGISHDFNNILSVILTYTSVLAGELDPGSPLQADLKEIRTAAQRGATLTKQLLMFSKQQSIDKQAIETRSTIQQLAKLLERVIPENIELVLELTQQELFVSLGRGQLEQVVMNLVLNARDAMPAGGRVSVGLSEVFVSQPQAELLSLQAGPYVRVRVSDSGVGMSAAVREKIFEPFFSTKGSKHGTGLGLPTVLAIVLKNHGALEATSTENVGSVFTVYFPKTDQTGLTEKTAKAGVRQGFPTVLYVEDDHALRHGMARYLRETGIEVHEAENGAAALAFLQQNAPKISWVISDMLMPVMGGLQLYDEVYRRWPQIRFIFLSGYFDHEVLPSEPGIIFLQKPFEPSELVATLQAAHSQPK